MSAFLKGNKTVCEKTDCCVGNGWLHLCRVRRQDTGVFFCDRQVNEQGVKWTFRRSVDVRALRKCCVSLHSQWERGNTGWTVTTPTGGIAVEMYVPLLALAWAVVGKNVETSQIKLESIQQKKKIPTMKWHVFNKYRHKLLKESSVHVVPALC